MAKTHRVSGRAVIIRSGSILLIKYNGGTYYNFPGGAVEMGETLAECVKREVFEESGITVAAEDMLFTLEIETRRHCITDDPHISVFFRCTVDDSAPTAAPGKPDFSPGNLSAKATAEWVPIEKLREINFLPYIPDNIIEYAETGRFSPSFLSGHLERKKAELQPSV